MNTEKIVIIDTVRSAHNVGSIFRTSDGAGVSRIILCGYAPAPIDRFGRVQNEIAKTSLGASSMVPWEKIEETQKVVERIEELKKQGFIIVSLEQTENAIALSDLVVPKKVAYILGNEIEGVSKAFLAVSDKVVHIPMLGKKESLNVAVAAGIIMYHQ